MPDLVGRRGSALRTRFVAAGGIEVLHRGQLVPDRDAVEANPGAPRHDMLDTCLHSRLAEVDAVGNTARDILPGR
jgi:hypothetical protein